MIGFHGEAFVQMDCKYNTTFSICKFFLHKYSISHAMTPLFGAQRRFLTSNAVQMSTVRTTLFAEFLFC